MGMNSKLLSLSCKVATSLNRSAGEEKGMQHALLTAHELMPDNQGFLLGTVVDDPCSEKRGEN